MAAPLGNQTAKGNSGGKPGRSGRKTAYGEKADADFLWEMFTKPIDKAQLAKRMKTGRHTILDVMVVKALAGNDTQITNVFRRLFPDNIALTTTASLNQKQMQTLEDNVRNILEVATKGIAKKRLIVGSDPERMAASIKMAEQALKRSKKKVVRKSV